MKQHRTDVFINGNYYDTFYIFAADEELAEQQAKELIEIEFETEEM